MQTNSLVLIGNAKSGSITALHVDGHLRHSADTHVGAGCNTFAIDATRSLVHTAVGEPEPAIVTLDLDRATGALTERGRRPIDAKLAYLELARDGALLLGASYHGGWGAAWPVEDGTVGEETSRIEHANMHATVRSPDGRHAYFVSLREDIVIPTELSAEGFTPTTAPIGCPEGSGPRHLVFVDDKNAYLLTEYSGEAIHLTRDPVSGALAAHEAIAGYDTERGLKHSRFGADPKAEHNIWGADLHLAVGGSILLCSERTESTITAIRLDKGRFTEVSAITDTEQQPRGFAVSPDGSRAVVVGEASGHAALYAVEIDGALTELDRLPTGDGPNWVRFV